MLLHIPTDLSKVTSVAISYLYLCGQCTFLQPISRLTFAVHVNQNSRLTENFSFWGNRMET